MEKKIVHKGLSARIMCAAFNVYNVLGCGFLEKVYENALSVELNRLNVRHTKQKLLYVYFRDEIVGEYIADIVVDNKIILEIKATQENHSIHEAQLLHYLKATNLKLGYLLNFGQKNKLFYKRYIN